MIEHLTEALKAVETPPSVVTWGAQRADGSLTYAVQGFEHTTGVCEVVARDILVIPNAIPFVMDQLIRTAGALGAWIKPTVARETTIEQDYSFRDCLAVTINRGVAPGLGPFQRVLQELEPLWLMAYQAIVNRHMDINRGGGWELLRYGVGHFFAEHVDVIHDHDALGSRRLSAIAVHGSDDVQGGDLLFPRQRVRVTPHGAVYAQQRSEKWSPVVGATPGTLILFPGTCSFPHEATEVLAGEKTSLVSFFS